MKSTKTILAVAIVIAGFASFGCGSDVDGGNTAGGGGPTLPSPSSIPTGIYSGTMDLDVTITVDGVSQQTSDSRFSTMIFDENGRFLDADGVPFLVGGTYFIDVGALSLQMFTRSITVIDNRILLRFDLTVHGDTGTAQIEMTGQQTETITFDAATDTLTFVRTQAYGGISSDGEIVDFAFEGSAILDRG